MKKILLLTDFSEASRNALQFAQAFFSDTVTNFHLLCVHPVDPRSLHNPLLVVETPPSPYALQLHEVVTELRRNATNDWQTFRSSACPGHLLPVVDQLLGAEVYDFVVIGVDQDDADGLFGNSAIALIRQLKVNILVVPVSARACSIRRVVLAADFANLKNAKLLSPVKELVAIKRADLTLLTIDTPGKKVIPVAQETHIRQFLTPIKPSIARLRAPTARQGINEYLAGHSVELLVTIPRHIEWTDAMPESSVTRSLAFTPAVTLLTLHDDGSDDQPQPINDLSTADYAL